MIDVVATTPLIVVVRILVLVEYANAFDDTTLLVATTPLIVVVRVLPERF